MAKKQKKSTTARKPARPATQTLPEDCTARKEGEKGSAEEPIGKKSRARRAPRAKARENWLRQNKLWRPFNFMGLPPELRERVYQYCIWDCERDASLGMDRLSWTLLPNLCDCSRQLRQETVPLFFELTKFKIPVASDVLWQVLSIKPEIGTEYRGNYERYHGTKDAGLILLSERTERILQTAGPATLFKHVIFEVCTSEEIDDIWHMEDHGPEQHRSDRRYGRGVQYRIGRMESSMLASLHLHCESGKLSCVTEQGRNHPDASGVHPSCRASDVAKTMNAGMAAAKSLSTMSGFNGFTFRDLKTIAAAFRAG